VITALIDYDSGNLRSAEKSLARMAGETNSGDVIVTNDPKHVRNADRIVLPGVGAFADCLNGLTSRPDLFEAIKTRVIDDAVPFLGICVGMQMMASVGREFQDTPGFDWISGEVIALNPSDPTLKVPHMGWNALTLLTEHPVFAGLSSDDHTYFVHSYHMMPSDPTMRIATCDHGQEITAAIGRDNMVGTQFHPEKSQATGLRLLANFLTWKP